MLATPPPPCRRSVYAEAEAQDGQEEAVMTPKLARILQLRKEFAAVHRQGMACLRRDDSDGLRIAIARERVIAEQFITLCGDRKKAKKRR